MIGLVYFEGMNFDCRPDHGFAQSVSGLTLLTHRSKAGDFACGDFPETQKLFVSFAAFCSSSLPAFCKGPLERRLLGWRSQRIKSRAAAEGIVKRLAKVTQARVAYFQRGLADVESARP